MHFVQNQNYLEISIYGQLMVPWGGPGSPQCPPNGTNYKDDQPLECLTHIWFHMRGLMGCRHCKMSDLFKNSYFLVHFCSLLGVPDCPRVLPSGPFFEIIKGLNPCFNCMLSWAGFGRFGRHNDWFKLPKNDFLMYRAKFTLFEPPWTRPNMSHPVLFLWQNVWACQPAK